MLRTAASRWLALISAGALALVGLALAEQSSAEPAHAETTTVFDSIPTTLAPTYLSQPFSALQVSEFGEAVTLTRGGDLASVSVVFVSFACETGNWSTGDCQTTPGSSDTVPITLKVYEPGPTGTVGAVLASTTLDQTIPFRPSADASGHCTGSDAGKWYDAATDSCNNGVAFTLDFPFDTQPAVPADVVIGVSLAESGGTAADLNVALGYDGNGIGTTIGTAGDVYVDSAVNAGYYCDERSDAIATGSFHSSPAWGEAGGDACVPLGIEVSLASVPGPSDPAPPAPTLPTTDVPAPQSSATNASGEPLSDPANQPQVSPAALTDPPVPGGTIPVVYPTGTFLPFEWVQFVFYSVPQYAESVQADSTGGLSASVPVPSAVAAGSHTLAATGTSSGVVVTAAVRVAAAAPSAAAESPSLAATGVDGAEVWTLSTIGAAALVLGAAALVGARQRRRSSR